MVVLDLITICYYCLEIPEEIFTQDLFLFSNYKIEPKIKYYSWFILAKPKNKIRKLLFNPIFDFLKKYNSNINYFIFNFIFLRDNKLF